MNQDPENAQGSAARVAGEPQPVMPTQPQPGAPTQPIGQPAPQYVPPELRPTGQQAAGGQPPQSQQWGAPPQAPYPPQGAAPQYVQPYVKERRRGAPVVGPLLLITAGVLFLLYNFGWLDMNIWGVLIQFWPLILVAIGLDLLIGRRSPALALLLVVVLLVAAAAFVYFGGASLGTGNVLSTQLNVPVGEAKSSTINLNMGFGQLDIGKGSESALAQGTLDYFESWGTPTISKPTEGGSAFVTIDQGARNRGPQWWGWGNARGNPKWDIQLNPDVPIALKVETGASQSTLNLEDLKVNRLDVNVGAGQVDITFPKSAGVTTATIKGGAGQVTITIPREVEAQIEARTGVGNVQVDGRFRKTSSGTYESSGYSTAANKLKVSVEAGVGQVIVASR